MRFLIVDDSVNIRTFIRKVLNMTGLPVEEILEAGNGQQGIEVLEKEKVDVVLTDINMPVMDGLEMIRLVKAQPRFSELKMIIVSTEGSREKILEAVKMGAAGYLKKPFGPEQVLNLLTETMQNGE
ncbi:MAG: hypothetical protein A2293_07435 [Elusimicrobia bacterium RIFOXYB2_FULL_49_7]|nr:MAG: hypothetical protein A2293_07435 [Elusimicrobia bacterium RIFOXYB2_FULL_49_7]